MEKHTTPMLFPMNPDQVWEKITEIVRTELQKTQHSQSHPVSYEVPGLVRKPIFKAHEICEMLDISRQTLHQWVKEGLLHCYKIKSRAYFLTDEVEALIKKGIT